MLVFDSNPGGMNIPRKQQQLTNLKEHVKGGREAAGMTSRAIQRDPRVRSKDNGLSPLQRENILGQEWTPGHLFSDKGSGGFGPGKPTGKPLIPMRKL